MDLRGPGERPVAFADHHPHGCGLNAILRPSQILVTVTRCRHCRGQSGLLPPRARLRRQRPPHRLGEPKFQAKAPRRSRPSPARGRSPRTRPRAVTPSPLGGLDNDRRKRCRALPAVTRTQSPQCALAMRCRQTSCDSWPDGHPKNAILTQRGLEMRLRMVVYCGCSKNRRCAPGELAPQFGTSIAAAAEHLLDPLDRFGAPSFGRNPAT